MAKRETAAPAFETKSGWAYRRLRDMIAHGDLQPGSRLVLKRLAESFGLSEMPVREALRMLQRDGLVEFESHRGATVVPISRGDVIDGVSMRMWLEVLAVREATPCHTRESLDRATKALAELAEAAKAGNADQYSALNRRFHEAVEAPSSEALRTTIAELWDRVWHARRTLSLFALQPQRIKEAQADHRLLLRAVRAGDVDAAADAMAAHREASLASWHAALGGT